MRLNCVREPEKLSETVPGCLVLLILPECCTAVSDAEK